MRCPLTEDWITPDPRPVHVVLANLQRNAGRRAQYAVRAAERFEREREAAAARRVLVPTEPFDLSQP